MIYNNLYITSDNLTLLNIISFEVYIIFRFYMSNTFFQRLTCVYKTNLIFSFGLTLGCINSEILLYLNKYLFTAQLYTVGAC